MNKKLAKYIYYTIQEIRKEPVLHYLRIMKNNDKLKRNDIYKLQEEKALKLINYAYNNSYYYKELFNKNNINISQIKSINDFNKIPILTKELLRKNLNKIFVSNYKRKFSYAKTSGSTGRVLKFPKDREATAIHNATFYRGLSWHGINIGDKEAMLWGVPVNKLEEYKIRFIDFMLNRFREKKYDLSPEILYDFYLKLKKRKPVFLSGYSSMIYQFTKFIKENNLDGRSLGLKIVKCTSETIYEEYFKLVNEVFGCPLVVEYGAAETNIVAFSCEKGNIHLMADYVLTEFIPFKTTNDSLQKSGYKELIITPLCNYIFPIIRYKIGDLGIPSDDQCECGRSLPLIKNIVGRSGAIVYGANGKEYHSILFYYIFKGLEEKKIGGVKQFKVYQKSKQRFLIQIVKDSKFSSKTIDYLNHKIMEKLGDDIKIDYEFINIIPREKSGKLRDFVPMGD